MMTTTFRTALLGLALFLPAGVGSADAQGTAAPDWHRIVDDTLGKPGVEQPGGIWRVGCREPI